MRAIGYVRWSSDEQSDGDSLNRQSASIEAYCKRQGLDLVETLIDEGLSASKGHHITDGKLGQFLADADAGGYRGHALVIEYLDRLSRLGITQTFALVERLRRAGVELHEVQHSRVIRSLDDMATAVMTVVDSYAAQEYSKKLSERIGRAWHSKKANAHDGRPITRNIPDWLRIEGRVYAGTKIIDAGRFAIDAERANAVREAFRLAALGVGTKDIAERINCTRSLSWLTRVLKGRAVLGEYQPQDAQKRAVGEPIQNFYPAIVDQVTYDAARKQLSSRRKGGRLTCKNGGAHNLFSGLLRDVTAEPVATMNFIEVKRWQYLISAWKKGRKQNRMRYKDFESAFLQFLSELDWRSVAGQTESDEQKQVERELERVLSDLDKASRRIAVKTEAMSDDGLDVATAKVLAAQIATDEKKVVELTSQREALTREVEAARAKSSALYSPESLIELIRSGAPEANEVRLRLRNEIKQRVSRIDFAFNQAGMARNTTTIAVVRFVNGAIRVLVFMSNGVVMSGLWDDQSSWVTLKT
jgi:DNA invertase Pin-like site-specific DNA recombinase